MKFPTLRFFAAVAIAFTVVNHLGIDLSAIHSNQSWIQSDRAEARRSGGRVRGGSSSSSRPRSTTTRSSSWSDGNSSGGTRHTTSSWSDDHGVGQSSTTSTHSNSSWSNESSSGRSSQSSTIHRSTYSGTYHPAALPVAESDDVEQSSDPFMQLMMLFLLLGGGIAAGLLVYLVYKQMAEQRSPVE